jgi:hypothetical protein
MKKILNTSFSQRNYNAIVEMSMPPSPHNNCFSLKMASTQYLNINILKWYFFFGFLHEVTHVLTALFVGVPWQDGIILKDGFVPFLYRMLIGRYTVIQGDLDVTSEESLFLIRHAGWIVSVIIALVVPRENKTLRWIATLTAVEAIFSDFFKLQLFLPIQPIIHGEASALFFCGNFGVILLHHLWLSDKGESALDIIEKMVKVTMMRGAQSGGVITFKPKFSSLKKDKMTLKGTRSRVVNQKRTDLSVQIRKIIQRDVFRSCNSFPKDFVPVLSGHTRFATTSKATMEGTHPHRWTPAVSRRVYDFATLQNGAANDKVWTPRILEVENFITHNGDFDFYVVNGKTYDLEIIQKWLAISTGCPMPAAVDSCAVAGVIDILRTQGCFGLSARYAVCLGLPTSRMEEDIEDFPTYKHFELLGLVFEEVMVEILKSQSFESLESNPGSRHGFVLRVTSMLSEQNVELIAPIGRYLDIESGSSLEHFCKVTIDAFFDNDLFMTTKFFLNNAKGSFGLCVTSSLDAHRQICLAARGQTVSSCFILSFLIFR